MHLISPFSQTAHLLEGLGPFNQLNFKYMSQGHLLDKKPSKCSSLIRRYCGRCYCIVCDRSGGKCDGAEQWQSSQDILADKFLWSGRFPLFLPVLLFSSFTCFRIPTYTNRVKEVTIHPLGQDYFWFARDHLLLTLILKRKRSNQELVRMSSG